VILVIAVVVLSAASLHRLVFADLPGPVFEFSGETMGTSFLVKVAAPTMSRDAQQVAAAAIRDRLAAVNAQMSTWDPDSELSRFNAYAATDPFAVSADTLRVVAASRQVAEDSGGAFDVTIRPLVQAWGFGDGARVPGGPTPAELRALRERIGWQRVSIGDGALQKSRPDVVCDLSAVAKGFAADAVSTDLVALGHLDHLVEIGGELRARGERQDGAAWRVAIEEPDGAQGRSIHRVIPLADRGMATSGDYRNYYEQDGVRISHTIDPRSGQPIRHALASVTVLHDEAMLADAWATALNVLGPEEGYALAVERGMAAYFIVRNPDATFSARGTPAFQASMDSAVPRPDDPES
jgi:thiamine biosynthesis lipoprotein